MPSRRHRDSDLLPPRGRGVARSDDDCDLGPDSGARHGYRRVQRRHRRPAQARVEAGHDPQDADSAHRLTSSRRPDCDRRHRPAIGRQPGRDGAVRQVDRAEEPHRAAGPCPMGQPPAAGRQASSALLSAGAHQVNSANSDQGRSHWLPEARYVFHTSWTASLSKICRSASGGSRAEPQRGAQHRRHPGADGKQEPLLGRSITSLGNRSRNASTINRFRLDLTDLGRDITKSTSRLSR